MNQIEDPLLARFYQFQWLQGIPKMKPHNSYSNYPCQTVTQQSHTVKPHNSHKSQVGKNMREHNTIQNMDSSLRAKKLVSLTAHNSEARLQISKGRRREGQDNQGKPQLKNHPMCFLFLFSEDRPFPWQHKNQYFPAEFEATPKACSICP